MARRGGVTNRGDITLSRGWLYQKCLKQLDMSDIRPRHPPPLEAGARQLLHVAYRGWVTSVQFVSITN